MADVTIDGVAIMGEVAVDSRTSAYAKLAGISQVIKTTIDLNQAAAAYDLFTGDTADFVIEALFFRMPAAPDMSDDGTITSIALATDDAEPFVFIASADALVAILTPEAQVGWTGVGVINVGSKIQLTIAGGAADAATVIEVYAVGRASADGGTLV